MRNAGLVFGCDYALVSVVTERAADGNWRAIARGPNGERLDMLGVDDESASVALLNDVIDRANGQPVVAQRLEATPEPHTAVSLSKTSRLELITDIRRELDERDDR